MNRRNFLGTASTASLPLLFNRAPLGMSSGSLFGALSAKESDKVLVLIQLSGGNDGLNTVVPLDQYDNLAALRRNVLLPERDLLGIDDKRALHPALEGLLGLHDEGRLGIVQGVAYPDQNRSHFRSTDIWQTGSPSKEVWTEGWLGRHFDGEYPGFPEGYPNARRPDPVAVTVGNSVSETCQGAGGNFALTLSSPEWVTNILEVEGAEAPASLYGDELAYMRTSISQSNAYGAVVQEAAQKADNLTSYPEGNKLGKQLSHVVRMIAGGLSTKVYVVTLGGFDTHADQVVAGDPTVGKHAEKLRELGDAIAAFQADLNANGLGERVVGMTYSEFGRRIRSNGALGTDHGTAAPLLLFGDCVRPGALGKNTSIDSQVDEHEGEPMQYDFRDVYGTLLQDWFGLDDGTVRSVLHQRYTHLPILDDCNEQPVVSATGGAHPESASAMRLAPSHFSHHTDIEFTTSAPGKVTLAAFDVQGRLLETLFERRLPAGEQRVGVNTSRYPKGVVTFRLQRAADVHVVRGVHQ